MVYTGEWGDGFGGVVWGGGGPPEKKPPRPIFGQVLWGHRDKKEVGVF